MIEFVYDSPLEQRGFEPPVPPRTERNVGRGVCLPASRRVRGGTQSSNPACSSGQSVSLPQPLSKVENPRFPRGSGQLAWRPGQLVRAMLYIEWFVSRHYVADTRFETLCDAALKIASVDGWHICTHAVVSSPYEAKQYVRLVTGPGRSQCQEGRIGHTAARRMRRTHLPTALASLTAWFHRNRSSAT